MRNKVEYLDEMIHLEQVSRVKLNIQVKRIKRIDKIKNNEEWEKVLVNVEEDTMRIKENARRVEAKINKIKKDTWNIEEAQEEWQEKHERLKSRLDYIVKTERKVPE